jgi:hypothetical protein
MNIAIMGRIDNDLSITTTKDPEVKQRWYSMGLYLNYQPVYTPAQTWVSQMGRLKYIKPVYASLVDSGQTTLAEQWYDANYSFYCSTT